MSTAEAIPAAETVKGTTNDQESQNDVKPRRIFGNNASAAFLSELKGSAVIVKQPSGIEHRGILQAVDGFLNVVLSDTKEVYDGNVIAELGEVFLRGSSVDYIAAA